MTYYTQQSEFEDWCEKWEKAQDEGVFDNAPKPTVPSSQTADTSFFGPSNTEPTDCPKDVDADYWNQVYQLSHGNDVAPDILSENKERMKYPPNPVRVDSGGKDQALEPESLGVTFDEKDVEELHNMKVRLHELEDKYASAMGKGENYKKFESQLESLKKKVDSLSNALGHSYPTEIAKKASS